jgi:hypothetical protein
VVAQADRERDEPPGGAVVRLAHYSKLYHYYPDMLLGRVSSDAIAIVLYVVRRTIGYGRDALEAVDGDVAKALGVSLRSFQRAKAELRAARVFEMAAGAGRGKPTVYALTEPETWALPANMADNQPEDRLPANMADNRQSRMDSGPVALPANMADNDYPPKMSRQPANMAGNRARQTTHEEPAAPVTKPSGATSPSEVSTIPERKKERDMRATHAEGGSSSSASRKPAKEADPQSAYTQELVMALQEAMGAKIANWARERKAAAWYLTAGADGGPAPIPDVMGVYREMVDDPWWDGKPIGLEVLKTRWSARVARSKRANTTATAARGAPMAGRGPHAAPVAVVRVPTSVWDD